MSNAERISIIGAGSAQFSMDLVRDISLTKGLQGSQLVFMDINKEKLSLVLNLAERFKNEIGADIHFEATTDRKGAITDSKFVINTALAGGHDQMEKERETQQNNGYFHGIAVHAPHRQLELMQSIAEDVGKFSDRNAYLIQISNPLPEGCTLMKRMTGINIIGLCDGYLAYKNILKVLNLSEKNVDFEAIGINHNIWMTKFRLDNRDAYPLIDGWLDKQTEESLNSCNLYNSEYQLSAASIDLYKLYGLMPIGDTCRASWPEAWWYHVDDDTKRRWWGSDGGHDGEKGWKLHLDWLETRIKKIREVATGNGRVMDVFPPVKSDGLVAPIIDAISNNKCKLFQINIPNNKNIPEIPDDFFVEVPAMIDATGVHTVQTEKLLQSVVLGAIIPRWLFAERLIAAYNTGDYRFLLQAYLSDHRTKNREQAEKTIYDVSTISGNETMAKHYDKFIGDYSKKK